MAQLRDLGPTLEEIMDEVKDFYIEEKDPFFKRGERKGLIKGELKGQIKGELRGELRGIKKTALKLKAMGLSILLIQKATGLTREQIRDLK